MIPDKAKMEDIIKELQKIMRIQDWDIEVKMCTASEMQKDTGAFDNLGEAFRNMRYKYAMIRLNKQDEENEKDWYHTLIHELKHVQTTEFIYTFEKLIENVPMDEALKKTFKEQSTDYYEQWMNVCAREFVSIYPVTNFIKEGDVLG